MKLDRWSGNKAMQYCRGFSEALVYALPWCQVAISPRDKDS